MLHERSFAVRLQLGCAGCNRRVLITGFRRALARVHAETLLERSCTTDGCANSNIAVNKPASFATCSHFCRPSPYCIYSGGHEGTAARTRDTPVGNSVAGWAITV